MASPNTLKQQNQFNVDAFIPVRQLNGKVKMLKRNVPKHTVGKVFFAGGTYVNQDKPLSKRDKHRLDATGK